MGGLVLRRERRGKHFQAQRLEILRELTEPDWDVSTAVKATENFTAADLKKLAKRIRIEANIRGFLENFLPNYYWNRCLPSRSGGHPKGSGELPPLGPCRTEQDDGEEVESGRGGGHGKAEAAPDGSAPLAGEGSPLSGLPLPSRLVLGDLRELWHPTGTRRPSPRAERLWEDPPGQGICGRDEIQCDYCKRTGTLVKVHRIE